MSGRYAIWVALFPKFLYGFMCAHQLLGGPKDIRQTLMNEELPQN